MYIVALIALGTSVDEEAPRLAAELGSTLYETALLLRARSPVLLLRTDDRGRALGLLSSMRARGHDAVACDASAVVSAEDMVQVRAFRLQLDALVLTSAASVEERVPWGSVVALVRAVHRTRVERVEKTAERKLSLGRATMSGGLLMAKTVTRTTTQSSEEREQVLYVFRRDGLPLLVSQSRVRYEGLGSEMQPAQLENFATVVRLLRERLPGAAYDERLLAPRPPLERVRADASGQSHASSSDGVDLLAHLVALASTRAIR